MANDNEEYQVPDRPDQFDIEVCECGKIIESCPDAYEHMTKGH